MTLMQATDNQNIKSYFDEKRSLERRQKKAKDLLVVIEENKTVTFKDLGSLFNLGIPIYLLLSKKLGQEKRILFTTVRDGLVPVKVLTEVVNDWFGWQAPKYTVVGERQLEPRDKDSDKYSDAINSGVISVTPPKAKELRPVKITLESEEGKKTFDLSVKQAEIISRAALSILKGFAKENK